MISLHNDQLTVEINELGAQLHSIKRQGEATEYLWQGDAASWGRQAPILFPFVGRLKDDQYVFEGQTYHQTQHGFARDRRFAVVEQESDRVVFEQHDDEQTRAAFPFAFRLFVTVELVWDSVHVDYRVENPDGQRTLVYAIGAHPGFNMPLTAGQDFDQIQLSVDPAGEYSRIVLDGPYNDSNHPQFIDMTKPLTLNHELFAHDAVIFKTAGSNFTATLHDPAGQHGVSVTTRGTQYVGVWSAYPAKANFVCVEPWWGIADNVNADGQLLHKQDMHRLAPGQTADYRFSIRPF
ncbi:aldose 1-epimerase family protein [Limosilactobacillus sp.]|uniref:aldose 1-epimerase family protein n=1 Tax=Limosilactobacillus sp. TaxID=2773925 RepID=UPI0025BC7D9F|nr:aldose 1-epimerase family protein [Limosilactobacillus sp.]MCH3922715.1 aldose 1-epimerase family protein [Limosilactobacillus sp.]MCH3927398.1 aldose 1-epimerase family protein [Limosilactobacillus sp.]